MVATQETVFTVLGDAARRRTAGSLALQLVVSTGIGVLILSTAPQWWSLAFLAGWSATYAAWGLLASDRETPGAGYRALLLSVAAASTALAVSGMIGLGLAFYSGNARGVKEACGRGSTNERCQAWANPAPPSRILR